MVRTHDPRQPNQQEKKEHEMTHLPFRSWCRHCIMGRGREEDCRKSMEEERQVLEVHFVTCSWETRRKGRRWHSWLQEKGIPVDEVRGWTRAVLSTVTSVGRLKGKSAKVQGMAFAEGILRKRKRAGGPLGKLTCMWEDGVYLGVKATTAEVIVGNETACG